MTTSPRDTHEPGDAAGLSRRHNVPFATIIAVFAIAALMAAIWMWSHVLLMAFAAILVAIALRGGATLLHRWTGLGFKPGVLITALVAVAVIVAAFGAAGPSVSRQFNQLLSSLPEAWQQVNDWLGNSSIGQFIERRIDAGGGSAPEAATGSLPSVFGYLTGTITTVFGVLADLVLMLTIAIFLALDGPTYRGGFLHLVPLSYRDRAGRVVDECGSALGRWMGGQALDMLIVALLTGAGLWLLGVPLALVLGLIAGLTNIIPVIGPFMSGIPAVMFALTQGVDQALYVTLLFLVIQQIEGNVLMPMIQQSAANLPPVLTVLAIVAFGGMFGLFGVILATPLLLVSIILVKRLYVEDVLGDRLSK
ncbi:AI-2E family transporter [Paracoccus stylophorae]|uniref:AI-2E family transporter n=1 Tax=Paracoccus stylophorae TaxID=659350 RepID=A0ABY7SSZ9_9RHOB|nr:AI-2E family transporter [Paracoccus stylophorae]WCR10154.1 AI-2E family transporter [Paracoccus stylophorae]